MSKKNDNIPFASRRELTLTIALACLNIGILGLILHLFDGINNVIPCVVTVLVYLAEVAVLGVIRKNRQLSLPSENIYDLLEESGSIVFKNSNHPIAAFDDDGILLWCNEAMLDVLKADENPIGKDAVTIFGPQIPSTRSSNHTFEYGGAIFNTESFVISGHYGNNINMLLLNDITDVKVAEKKYLDSRVCVAYIAIDNVEDVLQYVHEKFRVAVSTVDEKLKTWANSIDAMIKSYDNDKYIMLLDSVSLEKCVETRFSILDTIREVRVGDGVSITVSMGISRSEGTLLDKEFAARDAIDLALQRGGDQVVYNDNGVTHYFGGRTKSVYKKSNVRSRTFTNQLVALMARSDNVLIMGHRYGDFDSFGASIGVARLAALCGVKANIAVDLRDKNLMPCIEVMQQLEDYSKTFVDNADGLDLVGPDTLLVLVDHNICARAQFADISAKIKTTVIIDHHRKIDSFDDSVKLYYIEPSASSACELVAEMLESALSSQSLYKAEADMLLSGILLDTKQFTRNTGTRTFGAAQYLRAAGADPTDVYALFKTAPDDLKKEAKFHTSITIYRGNIAVSACDGETDETYRVIASKAADKMLTLRGIDAAFTLVKIGEQIHISGRSNGTVNVQLILEKLNGGGHFDVAGAQVNDESIFKVLDKLKSSIDDYLES